MTQLSTARGARTIGPDTPVGELPGVGARRRAALERMSITTVGDLLLHLPRDYRSRPPLTPISELVVGERFAVRGELAGVRVRRRGRGRGDTVARLADGTGVIDLVWFQQPYVADRLAGGDTVVVWGPVSTFRGLQMSSPEFAQVTDGGSGAPVGYDPDVVEPVYPLTDGLTQKLLRSWIESALRHVTRRLDDPMPREILARFDLPAAADAIAAVHLPASGTPLDGARRRLVFDELFLTALSLGRWRRSLPSRPAGRHSSASLDDVTRGLPFTLTSAQAAALEDLLGDLGSDRMMHRLLEGDVGSGKTVVALCAARAAVSAGAQVALMVPTEILAHQHARSAAAIVPELRVGLWTGGTAGMVTGLGFDTPSSGGTPRDHMLERLAQGHCDLVIGTHALFSDGVEFSRLGLVIVDEQHRFGVTQRAALHAKGENPDMLVMTATPIPRSLALTAFGDLDLSVIDGLPPGRVLADTYIAQPDHRDRVHRYLDRRIEEGQQVLVVAPRIDEEGESDLMAVTRCFEELGAHQALRHRRLALLHGRMSGADKEAVVGRLRNGDLDLVVATTVVEVGLDVPSVNVLVIENPERYGLSQLHQLRGRVGRGSERGECILALAGEVSETARGRLERFSKARDGFEVAELDLEDRGVGELLGRRQHGFRGFRVADIIRDRTLLDGARDAATKLLDADVDLRRYAKLVTVLEQFEREGPGSCRSVLGTTTG